MAHAIPKPNFAVCFLAARPQFLTAAAAPILVGSALGFAASGQFDFILFLLALISIVTLQAGANIVNDYYDHVSGNDWVNKNTSPFSGGSQLIQQYAISPKATLILGLCILTVGSVLGMAIFLITKSLFIIILGLIGVLGAFFYTAPPIKFGYRGFGEVAIAFLFGLLPVAAAYYLQAGSVHAITTLPGLIVGILVFQIIFINEFPDLSADSEANKKTLVVRFGVEICSWLYKILIAATFITAAVMLFFNVTFWAGLLYLILIPLGIIAIKAANVKDLKTPGLFKANQMTIILHSAGSVMLTVGFIISGIW